MGRPKVGERIELRLDAGVLEAIDDRLKGTGLTRAAWIRAAVGNALMGFPVVEEKRVIPVVERTSAPSPAKARSPRRLTARATDEPPSQRDMMLKTCVCEHSKSVHYMGRCTEECGCERYEAR